MTERPRWPGESPDRYSPPKESRSPSVPRTASTQRCVQTGPQTASAPTPDDYFRTGQDTRVSPPIDYPEPASDDSYETPAYKPGSTSRFVAIGVLIIVLVIAAVISGFALFNIHPAQSSPPPVAAPNTELQQLANKCDQNLAEDQQAWMTSTTDPGAFKEVCHQDVLWFPVEHPDYHDDIGPRCDAMTAFYTWAPLDSRFTTVAIGSLYQDPDNSASFNGTTIGSMTEADNPCHFGPSQPPAKPAPCAYAKYLLKKGPISYQDPTTLVDRNILNLADYPGQQCVAPRPTPTVAPTTTTTVPPTTTTTVPPTTTTTPPPTTTVPMTTTTPPPTTTTTVTTTTPSATTTTTTPVAPAADNNLVTTTPSS